MQKNAQAVAFLPGLLRLFEIIEFLNRFLGSLRVSQSDFSLLLCFRGVLSHLPPPSLLPACFHSFCRL